VLLFGLLFSQETILNRHPGSRSGLRPADFEPLPAAATAPVRMFRIEAKEAGFARALQKGIFWAFLFVFGGAS
jgi:hypothetical protein